MPSGWLPTTMKNGDSSIDFDFNLPNISRATITGIAVAVSGNILISLALNCQKLAHRRLEAEREAKREAAAKSNGDQHTAHSDISDGSYFPPDRRVNGSETSHRSSETDPLLGSSTSGLAHTSNGRTEVNRSFFSRLWNGRAGRAARKADRTHVGATHILMPVDVVTVNGTSDSSHNSSHDSKPDGDEDLHDGNESDYLKSKLW